MIPYHPDFTPNTTGSLHEWSNESDNCGMGAIALLNGERNYQALDHAITSVCNMTHRGAVDADMKTGDGAGVLTQIPYPIFRKAASSMGHEIKDENDLAVGVFFLPQGNDETQTEVKCAAESIVARRGITLVGWRQVPVHPDELGEIARETQPEILHLILEKPLGWEAAFYERQLFLIRRELEKQFAELSGFYIPTLSSRLISYKGLAQPETLRAFYADLQDSDYQIGISLYHQRFSTNTFPAWPLGQPFRMLCHNGEINTVRGNRNWMASREEFFDSDLWGDDIELLKNILSSEESDSASLDRAFELLVLSGRSLEHAMCMLVPPAFRHDPEISDQVRAFYSYLSSFVEPWDGPAGLVYTDGTKVCASLDRNGLRPSRFTLTSDGLLYIGSESGTIQIPPEKVIRRGRLGPGQMLSANTATGELKLDREIKEELATQQPYGKWVDQNRTELKNFVTPDPQIPADDLDPVYLSRCQVTHGITLEDLDMVFPPMIKAAQEAVHSMGDDIPLAPLSRYPRLLFTYFKQLFAQVTNPPIDPIREWAVMTLSAGLGPERNLLKETPEHGRILQLESAILFEQELEAIRNREEHGFLAVSIDATWDLEEGPGGLKTALDRVCQLAERAVDDGVEILILSDRAFSETRVSLPSLLVTGAVHHHLNGVRKRMRASIVVETGEARDTHQIACLFGFGATAVCPYLGYATVRQVVATDNRKKLGESMTPQLAMTNYRKALEKGLLKIMSKMGISVLNSYQGAQIFEAIGVGQSVIDYCFSGTHSRIAGVGFSDIAEESIIRHRAAWETDIPEGETLDLGDPGYNRYRRTGERHALTTEVIKNFHTFVKTGDKDTYEDYVKATLETTPSTIKDLLEFVPDTHGPVPLDEVESIDEIRRRFTTAAMSMGALSPEAHETLAIAMNAIGGKSDSGEGGEDPRRFEPYPNGDWARSRIKQVASGRFGVSAHYLVNCDEIEIKMAQGAKPGEGGQLPGHKVNGLIARLRHTQPGVQLISPPPHHDIYSIEDLAQLIHDLKEINPRAKVTVKLVAESGVGTIAAGVAKADADVILVSGHDGGTGASPLSSIKHAGLPWELGVSETQQTLVLNNLRNRVTLRTDGGMRTGRDIVIAAMLGAEEYNFGTIAMIAMGCVYVRKCHLNTCPVGIATTSPKYRAKFKGTPEMVIQFFDSVAQEAREIMASIGVRRMADLIGYTSYLRQREVPDHNKANTIDLSTVLKDVAPEVAERSGIPLRDIARTRQLERNDGMHKPALDLRIIQDIANRTASGSGTTDALSESSDAQHVEETFRRLMDQPPISLDYEVVNTDRNIGTRLSGRVAEIYGNSGLPDGTINLEFRGSAGQSFGCFLCSGLRLELIGEGNDYVGKGMSGGEVIIRPPDTIAPEFEAASNSIVGNTVLYGATAGTLLVNGCAGERFCVRNSGATAVVEGVGDHGCEYMTNGLTVILGLTGKNFGAGMSGGTAYVYDIDGLFQSRINPEMIIALPVKRSEDIAEAKGLIEAHHRQTGSPRARLLLDDWEAALIKLIRVIPKERAELERQESQHENATEPVALK